jgi:hypothetical protein
MLPTYINLLLCRSGENTWFLSVLTPLRNDHNIQMKWWIKAILNLNFQRYDCSFPKIEKEWFENSEYANIVHWWEWEGWLSSLSFFSGSQYKPHSPATTDYFYHECVRLAHYGMNTFVFHNKILLSRQSYEVDTCQIQYQWEIERERRKSWPLRLDRSETCFCQFMPEVLKGCAYHLCISCSHLHNVDKYLLPMIIMKVKLGGNKSSWTIPIM